MGKTYFVRHGESVANVERTFAGQREDSPLTELGKEQAKQAALDFLNRSFEIDRIVASPLKRAHDTAKIIIRETGLNLQIETDSRIAEYDMGDLTGTTYHKITSEELVAAKNAEDLYAFQNRVNSLLEELTNKDENVLIVSHAGVGRMIEVIKKKLDPRSFYDLDPQPNAKIIVLD
jgi:probable phosphoglycerate mutase